jgi:tRNA(Ile2) C34 agmatinyltransferase TiaS
MFIDTSKTYNRNRAKCTRCNTVVESKHKHDFVTCKCGNLSVDGGLDYKKRTYNEAEQWLEVADDE